MLRQLVWFKRRPFLSPRNLQQGSIGSIQCSFFFFFACFLFYTIQGKSYIQHVGQGMTNLSVATSMVLHALYATTEVSSSMRRKRDGLNQPMRIPALASSSVLSMKERTPATRLANRG